jgi:uncharacterized cofD-like protein
MRRLKPHVPHRKLVVIGGGTGSFTMLQALKSLTPDITAIVNMADDGGSTGMLRDELGVLPPGDVRQCLVALSRSPRLREAFNYRFSEGGLKGHSFGNLFLTALEKQTGNFAEAVRAASDMLNIQGRVVPITLDNVQLVYEDAKGRKTYGQHRIDTMKFATSDAQPPRISLEPSAAINPEALLAIREAQLIVIAPGDIYTSIGPLLVVDGVSEALQRTKARIAYVCNLVVKPGQTTGMDVTAHAAEIERLAGGPILDYVLYNTAKPPVRLLKKYAKDGELLVEYTNKQLKKNHYKSIGGEFIAEQGGRAEAHDPLSKHRSLIRHDPQAIKRAIKHVMYSRTLLTKLK